MFSLCSFAFASEVQETSGAAISTVSLVDGTVPSDSLLEDSAKLGSRQKPTQSWSLNNNPYHATLDTVGTGYLYTNYYFYPSSSGEFHVDYDVTNDGGAILEIIACDLDNNVNTIWTSSSLKATETTGSMYFYNLNTSHKYAIAFASKYDGFSVTYIYGSTTIYF